MKVKINAPKPVKIPPVTIDLTSLSIGELHALTHGVGQQNTSQLQRDGIRGVDNRVLFDTLLAACRSAGVPYSF